MRFLGSQMSHLRAFLCREYRDYALFGVEFLAEICQKFSEILRILAEILRKKLATGASVQSVIDLFAKQLNNALSLHYAYTGAPV